MPVVLETNMPNLFRKGKVRDTYDLGNKLLMIATDRISAFDVVLPSGIPDKGEVLTRITDFWLKKLAHLAPNHLIETITDVAQLEPYRDILGRNTDLTQLVGRSMLVKKAEPILVECVVRGYISGSGWAEYRSNGTLAGELLPPGLRESEELTEPKFTPSTKADTGHDENITIAEMAHMVGSDLTETLRKYSVSLYEHARGYARGRGIILADTKFEFGMMDGKVILIDEVLTPDSSRFWDNRDYRPGIAPPSFDKQYVRDWLTASGWNKEPPAPELPPDVITNTTEKYHEAFLRLTGEPLRAD